MPSLPPIYSHNGATGTGAGETVDISVADTPSPPHIQLFITGVATVKIEGSHDLVNWADYSGGGFTSSDSRKLIPGIRYWRTNIVSNSGSVTSVVGPVPTDHGIRSVGPRMVSTNAPV